MFRDQELERAYQALHAALKHYPAGTAPELMVHVQGATLLLLLRVCDRLAARVDKLEEDFDAEKRAGTL